MLKGNFKKLAALTLSLSIGVGATALADTNTSSNSLIKNHPTTSSNKEGKGRFIGHSKVIEKLGLTKEDIQSAKKSGKTLFDLAKEKGYTPEQVRNMIIQDKTDKINKAVLEGKLTREKGDEKISKVKEKVSKWDGSLTRKK